MVSIGLLNAPTVLVIERWILKNSTRKPKKVAKKACYVYDYVNYSILLYNNIFKLIHGLRKIHTDIMWKC